MMPVATAALRDSAPPLAGMVMRWVSRGSMSGDMPVLSLPMTTKAVGGGVVWNRLVPCRVAPSMGMLG